MPLGNFITTNGRRRCTIDGTRTLELAFTVSALDAEGLNPLRLPSDGADQPGIAQSKKEIGTAAG